MKSSVLLIYLSAMFSKDLISISCSFEWGSSKGINEKVDIIFDFTPWSVFESLADRNCKNKSDNLEPYSFCDINNNFNKMNKIDKLIKEEKDLYDNIKKLIKGKKSSTVKSVLEQINNGLINMSVIQ